MSLRTSRVHLLLLAVQVALLWPALTVWRHSVTFLICISLYANIATEWGAYEGARAKELEEEGG